MRKNPPVPVELVVTKEPGIIPHDIAILALFVTQILLGLNVLL
ncbi:MAG: hypothetical protein PF518_12175 [Spirochaetaceae bacterium]|nr:hypothetical protein [Spirochaetaceae bacterium]